ncbi:MAG: YdiU family protein, partial [Coriobacteriia bacterium]|nr:YdiU family protein [Coriobacteriia bacterium]
EQIAPDGRRFDLQLKGSGRTPYSRQGDGYAALAPMLREYLISEALFYLGISTTRSLAVVLTGQEVFRDKALAGAVLTRVAASHVRVGTFDYAARFGTPELVRRLCDYSIWRHFPWLEEGAGVGSENPNEMLAPDPAQHPAKDPQMYLRLFREVCRLQAETIAKWQLVGFIHGVMNTDNMAISGETLDFGPCAFMDAYNPQTVFSSIDTYGRYAYQNQPAIGAWNLSRLAEDLLPLFSDDQDQAVDLAKAEIAAYWQAYDENWLAGMRLKLGLLDKKEDTDAVLIVELLELMKEDRLDYTKTFRALCSCALSGAGQTLAASSADKAPAALLGVPRFALWQEKWQNRLSRQHKDPVEVSSTMRRHNPAVIPRNNWVEEALSSAENGDLTLFHTLLDVLSRPFADPEGHSLPSDQTPQGYQTICGT